MQLDKLKTQLKKATLENEEKTKEKDQNQNILDFAQQLQNISQAQTTNIQNV